MSFYKSKTKPALWTLSARQKRQTAHSKSAARKRIYLRERKDFLVANPWCAWGLKQTPPQYLRSEQIHHSRGRLGKLLLDQRYWLAVSAAGHEWIHRNQTQARAIGLLCAVGDWNKQPTHYEGSTP